MNYNLREGLEINDLNRGLVEKTVQIDRFKSKIGRDEDVCVMNFLVNGKEPALDLMGFIERGYDFVIDSDTSPGENKDGSYEVFVEMDRDEKLHENILKIISQVCNLTENKEEDWSFTYRGNFKDVSQLTAESLEEKVPSDPKIYNEKYADEEIAKLKAMAHLKVDSKAPQTEEMNAIGRAAGII